VFLRVGRDAIGSSEEGSRLQWVEAFGGSDERAQWVEERVVVSHEPRDGHDMSHVIDRKRVATEFGVGSAVATHDRTPS
jgi:hypothetical protein